MSHDARLGVAPEAARLLEAAARASRTRDVEAALRILGSYATDVLGCDGSTVFVFDSQERSITPMAVTPSNDAQPIVEENISLRLSKDSCFWDCLFTDRVLIFEAGESERSSNDVMDFSGISMFALKSLISDDGPVGLLLLYWRDAQRNLSAEELALVSALSDMAGASVIRGRLFKELEQSEQKYRLLTENAGDLIFALDGSGRFSYLNPRALQILGYSPDELVGEYYSEVVTSESWESSQAAYRQAQQSGIDSFDYEWIGISRSGALVYLDVRASLVRLGGEVVGQQGIARDVTEHRRMQAEIERRGRELSLSQKRQSEMKHYLTLITSVQEDERKRISRELHDDTVQALVALSRQLEIVQDQIKTEPDMAIRRVQDMADFTDQTLEGLRRLTRDLRPPMLDDLGLEPALEWLASSVFERSGVCVEFECKGAQRRLSAEVEAGLYRMAQEGLNNAVRHARPNYIRIEVCYEEQAVVLTVIDDGKGFAVDCTRQSAAGTGRLGLVGIHERAQLLGGDVVIRSAPGCGTTLTARIPIPAVK